MRGNPGGFYNTAELLGQARLRAQRQAITQEERILRHFQANPALALTPDQVLQIMPSPVPLTSVRRAITNLTLRGLLMKTEQMREGSYGMSVHCWRLAAREPVQLELA